MALTFAAGMVARSLTSSAQRQAEAAAPAARPVLARVRRRVLEETILLQAQIERATTTNVAVPAGQTGTGLVVTALPEHVGAGVTMGSLVAAVSGRPVIVIPGSFVSYRDLSVGESGPDVGALQDGLQAIGLGTGADAHGVFGTGTLAAVEALYGRNGYALETTQSAAVGSTTASPGATATAAVAGKGGKAPKVTAFLPLGEIVGVGQGPVTVSSIGAGSGSVVPPGATLLTLEAGAVIASAPVTAEQEGKISAGMAVHVSPPYGRKVRSAVNFVGAAPAGGGTSPAGDQSGASAAGGPAGPDSGPEAVVTVPLPPGLGQRLGDGAGLAVVLRASAGPALVVPSIAITRDAAGRSWVSVSPGGSGTPKRIEVSVLLSADGDAAVSPVAAGGLADGDEVVVG